MIRLDDIDKKQFSEWLNKNKMKKPHLAFRGNGVDNVEIIKSVKTHQLILKTK